MRKYLLFLFYEKGLFKGEAYLSLVLIGLIVLFALLEGVGIGLIAPLLEASTNGDRLAKIPIIGAISNLFPQTEISERVFYIGIVMIVVLVVRGFTQFAMLALSTKIPLRLAKKLIMGGSERALWAAIDFVEGNPLGRHITVINAISDNASRILEYIIHMVSSLIVLGVYFCLMMVISWEMTLFSIICLGGLFYIQKLFTTVPSQRAAEKYNQFYIGQSSQLVESLGGALLVRNRAAEELVNEKYRIVVEKVKKWQFIRDLWAGLPRVVLPTGAGILISVLIIGISVIKREQVGEWMPVIIMFIIVLFRLLSPISVISNAYAQIIAYLPSVDQVITYWEEAEQTRQKTGAIPSQPLQTKIAVNDIFFSYVNSTVPAINGISFEIKKGHRVAMVGPSGGGKSTVVGLLSRFHELDSGCIQIDGQDLRNIEIRSWRRRIGFVNQDPFLFNDTVRNNLSFGLNDLSDEDIYLALNQAEAYQFVTELPNGMNTVLGDRGVRLSGGQKQRLAIAQALLGNPDLLILDEATSHLDSISQQAIHASIDRLPGNLTVFIIAHRLSTVQKVDEILVIDKGRIIEQGNHRYLMANSALYKQMVNTQELN